MYQLPMTQDQQRLADQQELKDVTDELAAFLVKYEGLYQEYRQLLSRKRGLQKALKETP